MTQERPIKNSYADAILQLAKDEGTPTAMRRAEDVRDVLEDITEGTRLTSERASASEMLRQINLAILVMQEPTYDAGP